MASAVGKISSYDIVFKASESMAFDLVRRMKLILIKVLDDGELDGSLGLNMKRMTNYIEFKARKEFAMKHFGFKLTDYESIREHVLINKRYNAEDAQSIASETMKRYSESIAVEKVAQEALKASKVLNWKYDKKRNWGNIADAGFTPGTRKITKDPTDFRDWLSCVDFMARRRYVCEEYGVHRTDITRLQTYAENIFNIVCEHRGAFACQAIAIEGIVNTASKSFNELNAMQNFGVEPTNEEFHGEGKETAVGQLAPSKFLFLDEEGNPLKECEKDSDDDLEYERDEMSIFMDSAEARKQYAQVSSLFSSSSSLNIDWSRIMKFMEFKARREYAMENYGAKLGDFESLKEIAFKLFQIDEANAAAVASETMTMDFQSLVVEKIADAAFKTSKILNWVSDNKGGNKLPKGICIADAGFKSPKSLRYCHKKMVADAFAAYTMETFGVNKVDIDHLKDYALKVFKNFADESLGEEEAIIMACQTISIEKLYDATFKALNSTLINNQLEETLLDGDMMEAIMLDYEYVEPMSNLVYVPDHLK